MFQDKSGNSQTQRKPPEYAQIFGLHFSDLWAKVGLVLTNFYACGITIFIPF